MTCLVLLLNGRDILKFSFYSSGTTVCETKLSVCEIKLPHYAFVCPDEPKIFSPLLAVCSSQIVDMRSKKKLIPRKNRSPSMGDH